MKLDDCIQYAKTMLHKLSRMMIMVETKEVMDSMGRRFSLHDVWSGPYGHQQIWGIVVADSILNSLLGNNNQGPVNFTRSFLTDDIVLILMNRLGNCMAIMVSALDANWFHNPKPQMFWTHLWSKAVHDADYFVPKPEHTHTTYGPMTVGDKVEVVQKGSSYGARGEILMFMSYQNPHWQFDMLIGDIAVQGLFHKVPANQIMILDESRKPVDKSLEKPDTEGDMLMKFFASSQHDVSSPWYNVEER